MGIKKSEQTALRQRRVLELYRDTANFHEVARQMNTTPTQVRHIYRQALKAIILPNVEEHRQIETLKLDQLQAKALEVLTAFHPYISGGEIVYAPCKDVYGIDAVDEQGNVIQVAVQDHGPILAAIDRLLKISERRSKLLGLDQPVKVDFSGKMELLTKTKPSKAALSKEEMIDELKERGLTFMFCETESGTLEDIDAQ